MSIEYECALEIRESIRQLTEAVEQLDVGTSFSTLLAEQIFTRIMTKISTNFALSEPMTEEQLREVAIYALHAAAIFADERRKRTDEQA